MRTLIPWAMGLVLLLAPGISAGDPLEPLQVPDVVRLHLAGVSEDIIISEIIVTETVFYLTPDEIIRLKEAGLSDRLLQFMIDTARPAEMDEEESLLEPESGVYESTDEYSEWYDSDGEWVSVIEDEEEVTTNVHVSLDYHYGGWWYDYYWDDYWYFDWHYHPYRFSYVTYWGGWYPAWYNYYWDGYWWFAVRPYAGYRWWYYDAYGYRGWYHDYDYCPCDWNYYADGVPRHNLSTVKYKTNHYQQGTPVKMAYAGSGLKTPRFTHATVKTRKQPAEPPRGLDGKILAAKTKDRVNDRNPVKDHRPVDIRRRGLRPEGVEKTPPPGDRYQGDDRRPSGDRSWSGGKTPVKKTPVRTVRRPAPGKSPTKSVSKSDPPRKREPETAVEAPPVKRTPGKTKVETPPVKRTPTKTKVEAPPTKTKSKVRTAPRKSPSRKAKPRVQTPSRKAAPTRQAPTQTRAPKAPPSKKVSPSPSRPSPRSSGNPKRKG
jgi:hypothetical protein